MIRFRRTPLSFLALVGALALALSVAACGRKGPLELPTSAAEPDAPGTPGAWDPQNTAAAGQAGVRPADRPNDAYVRGAPAAKQPSILDRLID